MLRSSLAALLVLLLAASAAAPAAAQVRLEGVVRDAETGEALPAAHVRVTGTMVGTITNAEGRFELVVERLPVTLEVRFIGYRTGEVTAAPDGPRTLDVRLAPAPLVLDELVVTDEDAAVNIMRKVIARKAAWPRRPVRGEGFTRIVLRNDARIVLLAESVFDLYRDPERGPREVVRSRRRTGDLHERFGLHDAGRVPDLYADAVDLHGLAFLGVTHPDALDHYTFTLAGRRALDGGTVYDLYVAPKTFLQPTFMGRLSVLDSAYAVVEAELRPAPHVVFPEPIAAWPVFYTQQFAPVGDPVESVWLPVDLRAEGRIAIRPDGVERAPAFYRQTSRFTDYALGVPMPEGLFATDERVTVDTAAVLEDYLFLRAQGVVPLTPEEEEALYALRGDPPTLEEAFRPLDAAYAALAALRENDGAAQFRWPRYGAYAPWLWFNRVDGFHLGVAMLLPLSPRLTAEVRAAQSTTGGPVRREGFATFRPSARTFVRLGHAAATAPQGTGSLYALPAASLPPLLGGADYFDYVWNVRTHAEAGYAHGPLRLAVGVRDERHEAMDRRVGRGWPFGQAFRPNPAVPDVRLRTLTLGVGLGDPYRPLRTGALNGITIEAEAAPAALGGDAFVRGSVRADARVATFARGRLRPATLDVRLSAAAASRGAPPQRWGLVDGALGPVAPFGALRTRSGEPYRARRHVALFWEHDVRTLPFEALGLRALVDAGVGVRLFGGHVRLEGPDGPGAARAHHELGGSLTHLFGLPLRLDLGARLDRPGWTLGVGLVSRRR